MEQVVRITTGQVRGDQHERVSRFLGIPYAAPAIGHARFEVPRPAPAWDGVRDATRHGPTALQAPYAAPVDTLLPSSVDDGPDYLNVGVWTPDPGGSGLPVIVWFPGGAFVRGANSIATYDGTAFARDGVVMVGVNYRLGVAGFPVLPDAPTNLGIRDQILALQWVQENVAAFGGDPGNVTIMGESAGGMSVATLMAAPPARGLFRRAIVQSGGGSTVGDPDDLRRVVEEVAARLGVPTTAEALGQVAPEALLEAQTAVGLELALGPDPARWGATTIRAGLGITGFFPCVDGEVVLGPPSEVITGGSTVPVPLLTGTTAEEFRLFVVPTGVAAAVTPEAMPLLAARYGWPAELVERYSANRPDAPPGDVVAAILTDGAFRLPTVQLAEAAGAAGSTAHVYEFAWRTDLVAELGACHALELGFVFDTLGREPGPTLVGPGAPQSLATEMHSAWVSFASTGDPGWAAYTPDRRAVMTFGVPSEVVVDPRGDERRAWAPLLAGRS
ncbi:MAG: carboxylesterase family protein [Intrasporangium sp.]|uniref:carboxylesterase/lipase family protein n=1 Tax=Intrasporangium sp. TaxID=1925024 RepID=UPI00264788BD|nr:carboxylesterase family protein [Intrasporangium sp.]MDN5796097.1 carboxylesterase family protein [Intrasporangium sp.]